MTELSIHIDAWNDGELIPSRFAFCKLGEPVEMTDNINPAVSWSGAPEGTKSFVFLVTDPDVPSAADDVNVPDREVCATRRFCSNCSIRWTAWVTTPTSYLC